MKVFQIIFLPFLLYACSQSAEIEQTYLTEKIEYSSKNILGFENLFGDGLTSQKNVKIYGVLHFPDNYDSNKKYDFVDFAKHLNNFDSIKNNANDSIIINPIKAKINPPDRN